MGADRSGGNTSTHSGIIVVVTSGDLQDMYEVCSRASARESAAREAAKALKEELQCVVLEFIRMIAY